MTKHELYYIAVEKDEAFSVALRNAYKGKAGDMRYSYNLPSPLKELGEAYKEAMADYWNYQED